MRFLVPTVLSMSVGGELTTLAERSKAVSSQDTDTGSGAHTLTSPNWKPQEVHLDGWLVPVKARVGVGSLRGSLTDWAAPAE